MVLRRYIICVGLVIAVGFALLHLVVILLLLLFLLLLLIVLVAGIVPEILATTTTIMVDRIQPPTRIRSYQTIPFFIHDPQLDVHDTCRPLTTIL